MIQVLISTMHLNSPIELLDKMKVQTDAIIIDQCDYQGKEQIDYHGKLVEVFHTTERGLSRSRNMAIQKSTAEILIFADDDFYYTDGYASLVEHAYDSLRVADIVIFNAVKSDGNAYHAIPTGRLTAKHRGSVNSVRITARRDALIRNNAYFDVNFGAGSTIPSGEDNIFISDCYGKKLKIYSYNSILCTGLEAERASTWFIDYDEEYLFNKGVIFKRLSRFLYPMRIFYFAVRHNKKYSKNVSFIKAVQSMFKGAKYK